MSGNGKSAESAIVRLSQLRPVSSNQSVRLSQFDQIGSVSAIKSLVDAVFGELPILYFTIKVPEVRSG